MRAKLRATDCFCKFQFHFKNDRRWQTHVRLYLWQRGCCFVAEKEVQERRKVVIILSCCITSHSHQLEHISHSTSQSSESTQTITHLRHHPCVIVSFQYHINQSVTQIHSRCISSISIWSPPCPCIIAFIISCMPPPRSCLCICCNIPGGIERYPLSVSPYLSNYHLYSLASPGFELGLAYHQPPVLCLLQQTASSA